VGLLNVILTIHKAKLEGITQHRMEWISSVRSEIAYILCWKLIELDNSDEEKIESGLYELRHSIIMVSLYMNIGNKTDNKVIDHCSKLYRAALYCARHHETDKGYKEKRNEFFSERIELRNIMQIYLKKEWTRVKYESCAIKLPFKNYGVPFLGYREDWAIKSIKNKVEKIQAEQADIE